MIEPALQNECGPFYLIAAVIVLMFWGALFSFRPVWLQVASQDPVPTPIVSVLHWQQRATGLETAELKFQLRGEVVDRMVLVRLNPLHCKFSVHWDPSGSHTAEDWQQLLSAAVVVNGSYFDTDFVPLTPLRLDDISAGPLDYHSNHGALVIDGSNVDIVDLKGQHVSEFINQFPSAMVSYPILVSPDGENRAIETRTWLASRNFVGIDLEGNVVLGATETGFFTLHRLGEFLKQGPLGLRVALNLDGGPLVSQVVQVEGFSRQFHGTAEISKGSDVLRGIWHTVFKTNWTLPIVFAAVANSDSLP